MLEGPSLVRPLWIIILASLQKDSGSMLTRTLLTADKLAGHHIVPNIVHVSTQGVGVIPFKK